MFIIFMYFRFNDICNIYKLKINNTYALHSFHSHKYKKKIIINSESYNLNHITMKLLSYTNICLKLS